MAALPNHADGDRIGDRWNGLERSRWRQMATISAALPNHADGRAMLCASSSGSMPMATASATDLNGLERSRWRQMATVSPTDLNGLERLAVIRQSWNGLERSRWRPHRRPPDHDKLECLADLEGLAALPNHADGRAMLCASSSGSMPMATASATARP